MASTGEIIVSAINEVPDLISEVISLGNNNSKTLGFLPEGAFRDYEKKGQILVALAEDGRCIGYTLYRVSGHKVIIVHLCVERAYRYNGIAKKLILELSIRTKESHRGVGLTCRRDYEAHKVWPRLGFSPRYTKPGRSKKGSKLTFWWKDHYLKDLFSLLEDEDERLEVVIDANVFYDLEDIDRSTHRESSALLADWLEPYLKLLLTNEMYTEADRLEDEGSRKKAKKQISDYSIVKADQPLFIETHDRVRQFFPRQLSEQDKSDMRHLAWAIASDVLFFVTRDGGLLKRQSEIYNAFNLTILRPVDLIIRLEELSGEIKSQPVRLAGSLLEYQKLGEYNEELLSSRFLNHALGERKTEFKSHLRNYLADPKRFDARLIVDGSEKLALVVYDRGKTDALQVPLFRFSRSSSGPTIAYNLLLHILKLASKESRHFVSITDQYLDSYTVNRLKSDRFRHTSDGWLKICLDSDLPKEELIQRLEDLSSHEIHGGYVANIGSAMRAVDLCDDTTLSEFERFLWPLKILDAEIPTFLVPIHPHWAKNLFDDNMAREDLFGARPDLALNREGVYYRARHPHGGLKSPGRVLWYVTKQNRRVAGAGHLRAISHIDEIYIDKPSQLYKRFQRLGIYTWSDVLKAAKNLDKEIMAIYFSDTKLLPSPVSLSRMKKVFDSHSFKYTLQSPIKIPIQVFQDLYKIGNTKGVFEDA